MADFVGNRNRSVASAQPAADTRLIAIRSTLEKGKAEFQKILSRVCTPDEMIRLALTACVQNQKLLDCGKDARGIASIAIAILKAGAMGMRCDGFQGYLVPFWNKGGFMECVFMPGYRGWITLINKHEDARGFQAAVIKENDEFDYEYGSEAFLKHKPAMKERGDVIGTWAGCSFKDGFVFRVMSLEEIEKRREASRSKDDGPWVSWYEEMCIKTAVHNLAKFAPMGQHIERAITLDSKDDAGLLTKEEIVFNYGGDKEAPALPEPQADLQAIPEVKQPDKAPAGQLFDGGDKSYPGK